MEAPSSPRDTTNNNSKSSWITFSSSWNRQEQQLASCIELTQLGRDFVHFAKMYGKIIICETFLPDQFKTIKPVNVGGVAGNKKECVILQVVKNSLCMEYISNLQRIGRIYMVEMNML